MSVLSPRGSSARVGSVLVAFMAGCHWASYSSAQTIDENMWVTNGAVNAILADGGTVYIGGDFTYVGPPTGGGIPVNSADGTRVSSFPKVNGNVQVAAPDGSGGWFIGGRFDDVGGHPRRNLAHVRADLSVADWRADTNDAVAALALSGSTLYVGGYFNQVKNESRLRLAAIDTNTGTVLPWNPEAGGTSPWVLCLAVHGASVYAGGTFSTMGGFTRNRLAAIDAITGIVKLEWNANANDAVNALVVGGNQLYVGGAFTSINGYGSVRLASVDLTSGVRRNWGAWVNYGDVYAIIPGDSTVYVAGDFGTAQGRPLDGLAEFGMTAGNLTAWTPDVPSRQHRSIAIDDSRVYFGGGESFGVGTVNATGFVDRTTGAATAWFDAAGPISTVSISGSRIYIGGWFDSIGGYRRNHVAAIDANSGMATGWDPNANASVDALAATGSTVFAGGKFTQVGAQPHTYLAAIDASTGAALPWSAHPNYHVTCLAASSSTLFIGGRFTSIGVEQRPYLGALDTASGLLTAWNPTADNAVLAMAVSGSLLYVGGSFSHVGGQPRNKIAVLDTLGTALLNWRADASGDVTAIGFGDERVYAGGKFSSVGSQYRPYIAALAAATGGVVDPWGSNPDNQVLALAVGGHDLYIGGTFGTIGGRPRQLAKLDGATGVLREDWNPNPQGAVRSIAVAGNRVYVGGDFERLGGSQVHRYPHFVAVPTTITEVTLESFTAEDTGRGVRLAWEVSQEAAFRGFHVYRRAPGYGSYERRTEVLLVGSHEWVDRDAVPRATSDYQLRGLCDDEEERVLGHVSIEFAGRLATTLRGCTPSPFTHSAEIRFALAAPQPIVLTVHDARGRSVRRLFDRHAAAGEHLVVWDGRGGDGRDVANGVYFVRLSAGGKTVSQRVVRCGS